MFKTFMVMGFAALMLLAVLPFSAVSDSESRTFTPPAQTDLPTWKVGDFWLYNSSFTTSFAGWSNKVWTGHVNYTVQSTSVSAGGYDCYRLDMASEPTTSYPRLDGRSYIRKSDLSLVAMNWTEIGLTPTPYTHSYEVWFASVDYYDYYQFPIVTDMLKEKWYVNTTMNQHISNTPGPNHFDITRSDVITMNCEFVGWSDEDPNLPENQIGEKIDGSEQTNGNDKDIRWYNPDYKSYLYRDFKYSYNESGSWAGTEKLITSNYKPAALNQPPHVTNPTAKPSTVQNDDTETAVLEAKVTDDSGIGYVAVDLTPLGYNSNTTMSKNPFKANYYYVAATVKPTTLGGQYKLYVTAADNMGAVNNSVYISLTVTSTNDPPRVTDAKATPNSIPNDAKTASLLTANVNDTNLDTVIIDVSPLGGASTQQMYDDGTHGDATSGDEVFSFSATAATATPPSSYILKINASDTAGLYNNTQAINISVFHKENSKPKIESPKAEPSSIPNNAKNQTLLSAKVTDADTDPLTVTINLTFIGGPAVSLMYDDATHGDKTAGDKVYSVITTASKATEPNSYDLKITAYDNQDYVYSKVRLTVTETTYTNNPPTITDVTALPDKVTNDGSGDVLFTASVSDMEGDNLTVTINLSPLGGPLDLEMLDNGMGADNKKNDSIYSAIFTVEEGTTAKTYTLTVTATDEGAESDTATVSLIVDAGIIPDTDPAITFMSLSQNTVTSSNRNVTVSAYASDPESDPFEVYVDLSSVGGSDRQILYDDGTNGDVSGGDSTYSFKFTVPKETSNGNYTISTWVEQNGAQVGDKSTKPLKVSFVAVADDDDTVTDDDDSKPNDDNKWFWVGGIIAVFILFIIALLLFLRKPKGKGSLSDSEANENTSGVQARL